MNTQTKKRWNYLLIYVVLFLVIFLGASWWKSRDALSGNLSNFNGKLLDGTPFTLADYTGKPILLHFWATWCPICELQIDNIQAISQDYTVISIASWSEGKAAVNVYMQQNNLTFPVMLDDSGKLAQTFGLNGVPASFVVNRHGEIKFVETGYSTEYGLRFRLWLSDLQY